MGCIARLGCLVLLVILGVCAWFTRDRWLPQRFRSHPATSVTWQPATGAGATHTEDALEKLSQTRAPVYQTLTAGDLASFAFREAANRVGTSVDSVAARIDGDRLTMRGRVALSAIK